MADDHDKDPDPDPDPLSLTFAALADPTRRAILVRLAAQGEATVNELAQPFDISLQAISKHLKVLEGAGLITRGKDAQFRPCRFESAPLDSALTWIEENRQIWSDRFDQLEIHLRNLQRGTQTTTNATQPKDATPAPRGKRKKET
jgi:DNA-binding transcriptional ArsR family regulator